MARAWLLVMSCYVSPSQKLSQLCLPQAPSVVAQLAVVIFSLIMMLPICRNLVSREDDVIVH